MLLLPGTAPAVMTCCFSIIIPILPATPPSTSSSTISFQWAFMTDSTAPSQESHSWFVDSYANHHVKSDPQHLWNQSVQDGKEQILVGNDQGLPVHSIGSTFFSSPFNSTLILY